MNTSFTQTEVNAMVQEARAAAKVAADKFYAEKLKGQDQYACGFAWVNIWKYQGEKIRGNSKLGKMLTAAGVKQNYERAFQIWNPSGHPCQNVDTKEQGASAAAAVFEKFGFTAYAGSRLD